MIRFLSTIKIRGINPYARVDEALARHLKRIGANHSRGVQHLRDMDRTEPQIAEAVYVTAMFAFFNRVADAFGISPQGYLEMNSLTR